jgi:tetratricopeptide (TPR) repeat protein
MGQVYAAFDPQLDRKVALKLLHPDQGDGARASERLLREAKALARLSHRNVVAVHDAGTFGGRVFVAMEFVDGLTLEDWLRERRRDRHEIVAVFAGAARGLAAAHAAGLVHRDFKPANVMVGKDGAARVTDFGLARASAGEADDALPDGARAPAPRDASLTQTGELLGTPLYMAPEQFRRAPTDARTDQFSFCVALYRALYGGPPFGEGAADALVARVLAGRVEPPPARSSVPASLRRVILRGLSVDPAARWPSMDALVAALERDPTRTRRRWGVAAGALGLVALSVVTLARGGRPDAALCLGGPARLDGVWEDAPAAPAARRATIEKAFLGSGAPTARQVLERVAALLDRYRASWLGMYRDACEATHVRREQTAALLDLRMACLDERRLALASLSNVLAAADRDVVKSAVDAANALPSLDRCAHRAELEAPVAPPPDEATRRRVEAVHERAALAKALDDAGKHAEAETRVRAALGEARAIGYRPLVAEMLVATCRNFQVRNFSDEVLAIEAEATWLAVSVGRDDLAAEAAIQLAGSIGVDLARYDEGVAWSRVADALVDRAGGGHDLLRAWLLTNEGMTEYTAKHFTRALDLFERAVALKTRILRPDQPDVALGLNNEANTLAQLDRNEDALRVMQRAGEILVRAYGPESTEVGLALSNGSEYLVALGRPAQAVEQLQRAIAIWELQLGPEHFHLGYPLTALGRAYLALARPAEAIAPLERALRLREAHEKDVALVAETRFALGRAVWDAKADRARATHLAKEARATYGATGDAKHAAEIDAWLASTSARRP